MTPRTANSVGLLPLADVARMADTCVKCGLCLPHCPTYRISGVEGESPRGRIALVDGLAAGELPAAGQTVQHLENCTGCLRCESVCPADVPIGHLIDVGRAELRRRGHRGAAAARWLSALARRPRLSRVLVTLLRWARGLGVASLASAFGIGQDSAAGRVLARLPVSAGQRSPRRSTAAAIDRGPVMLFSGCISGSLDRRTLGDAVFVLERCRYDVSVPDSQDCCGALDLHDGRPERAARLAAGNCSAFGTGTAPILTLASGCAATLSEYGRLSPGEGDQFRSRLIDLNAFLDMAWEDDLVTLAPLSLRAALFQPCTVRKEAGGADRAGQLLRRIPGLELHELGTGFGCCGAAGHHFITRGRQADRLLAPILEEIQGLAPDYVLASNVGCALHLAGALEEARQPATVMHPVSLIRRSLERAR